MDWQQAQILLEKISSLQKSIALNKGPIAAIERDLMLSYIRQLYEIYLEGAESAPTTKSAAPEVPKAASKVIEPEQPRYEYTPPPAPEMPKTSLPPRQEVPPPPPRPETPKPTFTPSSVNKANFNGLFDFKQARELSEKLSERAISDLTKAFAINDKLLYINELFGRDANAFNDSLRTLNNFESIDEAKSLLLSLAEQYNWSDEEKMEIAQSFIRTVRRRYA